MIHRTKGMEWMIFFNFAVFLPNDTLFFCEREGVYVCVSEWEGEAYILGMKY